MRNATVTTIAPTGSISIIAQCSSGIEPLFAPVMIIRRLDQTFMEIHPLVEEELKKNNLYEKFIADENPELKNYLPELAELIVTAHEVTPEQHVATQAIWQKHTHNAVSKTINMPNSATKEDILKAYLHAYESGCKGLTVYRDGSRGYQVLETAGKEKENEPTDHNLDCIKPISRSDFGKTIGTTAKYKTACGTLYITINRDNNGNIIETFVNVSKTGVCKSNIDAVSRMVSVALRSGTMVEEIIDQLKGINCAACSRALAKKEKIDGCSCPDILAKAIQSEYESGEIYIKKNEEIQTIKKQIENIEYEICPECNEKTLRYESGCNICGNCGYSKCS